MSARYFAACCIAACCIFAAPSFLSSLHAQDTGPKLVLETREFDFGTVSQGTKVVHEFILQNKGSTPLELQRLVPDCGCTASSTSSDLIAPGAKGSVKVEFDTTGFSGEKRKSVRIYTNDPDNLSPMVVLKGIIEADVSVEPRRISFEEVIAEQGALANGLEFAVRVRPGSGVSIKDVKSYSRHVILTEVSKDPSAQMYRVTLAPGLPLGEFRDRIVVSLQGAKTSSINVPIFALIRAPVAIKPSLLSFGVLEAGSLTERSAKLENLGEAPVHVVSLTSSHPAISATYTTIEKGKVYVLKVQVDPSKVSRDLRATIEVLTDSAAAKSVSLTVVGMAAPTLR
jgi:hypothetical protein